MAGDMTAGILLRLKDQFSPALKSAGSNVEKFGGSAMGVVNKIDKAFSGAAAKLAGFGLTLGLGAAAKGLIDFDAEITRMGVQAGITDGEIRNLKQTIFDAATDPKIKLGYRGISDSMSEVIEMTGDMDFAEANIRNMGIAMRATASDGKAIGGLFSEFQKMGLGANDVAVAMDTLATQGNNGAFTLANLAALGPRTINAYRATGRDGTQALIEMGAALQVIRRGTGSSEQAATAFEAVMRNLTNPQKQEALAKMGIAVRDQAGNFRSITDIMEEIVLKSNGSLETIGTLFDAEAVRAFNSAIGEFQQTGVVGSFKQFEAMVGDGSALEDAAARNAKTLAANIEGLQSAFMNFVNSS
ncbi:MAG: phage tail tape measure protein, partial [Treponema sp.]|nr:phage tail tape measure protein [Treponema sp.]